MYGSQTWVLGRYKKAKKVGIGESGRQRDIHVSVYTHIYIDIHPYIRISSKVFKQSVICMWSVQKFHGFPNSFLTYKQSCFLCWSLEGSVSIMILLCNWFKDNFKSHGALCCCWGGSAKQGCIPPPQGPAGPNEGRQDNLQSVFKGCGRDRPALQNKEGKLKLHFQI